MGVEVRQVLVAVRRARVEVRLVAVWCVVVRVLVFDVAKEVVVVGPVEVLVIVWDVDVLEVGMASCVLVTTLVLVRVGVSVLGIAVRSVGVRRVAVIGMGVAVPVGVIGVTAGPSP